MTIDRPFVVIGDADDLRVRFFTAALAEWGRPCPLVVGYSELLAGRFDLLSLPPQSIVRFESPGKDFEVTKRLLARGAAEAEAESSPAIAPADVLRLEFDRGRIWFPRQWYLGLRNALRSWHAQLQTRQDALLTAWPPDIETLFDKRHCHALCRQSKVPVPQALEPVACYDELAARMAAQGWERAFVKLAHGSSASGALALHRHRGRVTAFTTVELAEGDGKPRLYNTRPVRTTRDENEVRRLVDALAPHRLHVEQWLPKASLGRGVFDLRIVVIGGRPRHAVVREGRSPITNLQLGNRRGSLAQLRKRLPDDRWHAVLATCSRIAAIHLQSLQLGVDILLTPGLREHVVLEINAFGDLLPGALDEGQTTFAAELAALQAGWP